MSENAETLAVDLEAIAEARDQLAPSNPTRDKLDRILARYPYQKPLPTLREAAERLLNEVKPGLPGLLPAVETAARVLGAVLARDEEVDLLPETPIHPTPISLGFLDKVLRDEERDLAIAIARHTGYVPTVNYDGEGNALREVSVTFVYRSKSGDHITRRVSDSHGPEAQWLLLALRKAWRYSRLDHVEVERGK